MIQKRNMTSGQTLGKVGVSVCPALYPWSWHLCSFPETPLTAPGLHPELAADPSLEEQSQGAAGRAETKSLQCCFPKSRGGCRGRAGMRWDQLCKTAQGCARHPEDRRPSGVSKD